MENHGHPHHEGTWHMKEDYNIMVLGLTQVLVIYGTCVNINLANTSTSHNIRIFFNIFRGKVGLICHQIQYTVSEYNMAKE